MEENKKNITLILGISIPVLMILLVAGAVYLPGIFIKPQFNFLYFSCDSYDCCSQEQYFVEEGKLVKNQDYDWSQKEVKLYIYDVVKDEAREVSFSGAQDFVLNSDAMSPDGFEIVYGSRYVGVFPFFWGGGTDYYSRYLKGHNLSKKLNLQLSRDPYYYNNFCFLGWME